MKKLSSLTLVGFAIVLAAVAPSYAAEGHGGHGVSGHSMGGHVEGHHAFDNRDHFEHRGRDRVFFGVPFYGAPDYSYAYPSSTYWYCPSYGAYYPAVSSCPDDWVPVSG